MVNFPQFALAAAYSTPGWIALKHFKRIDIPSSIVALPHLRSEIYDNQHLWTADESRQKRIRVQRKTQSIPLRSADRKPGDMRKSEDIHESRQTRFAAFFPATMTFLLDIASYLQGTLERALYVRLLPHSIVYPHIDNGAYYQTRDRYHLVLVSSAGSLLKSGDEQVVMQAGELWWFDNKAIHESDNSSDDWRIHLIFDIF